jgi:hypothetical protein
MATPDSICCSSAFPSHMTKLFIEWPIISLIVVNGSDKWQTAAKFPPRLLQCKSQIHNSVAQAKVWVVSIMSAVS